MTIALRPSVAAGDDESGAVEGRISLEIATISLEDVFPLIVYLAGSEGPLSFEAPNTPALIKQSGARFSPSFSAVPVGQSVEMRNDDTIFHNVFSYSAPNDFDLGIYPKGTSRFQVFESPGLVRYYCAIHESMNGLIFVAPSPYFVHADRSGRFRIEDVPPDRYAVRVWSPLLSEQSQFVRVRSGQAQQVDFRIVEISADPSGLK